MARLLLVFIFIVLEQHIVNCIPFDSFEYKRAASDENNLLDDNNGDSDGSDFSNKHKTKDKIQHSDPLDAGLDTKDTDSAKSGQGVNTKGDIGSDDKSSQASHPDGPNPVDDKNNPSPKADTASLGGDRNNDVLNTKIESIKQDQMAELVGNTDKSSQDDNDKITENMVTPLKISTASAGSNPPLSDNNGLETVPPTVLTSKSTTETGDNAGNATPDMGLDKPVTDKTIPPTVSTLKSTTKLGALENNPKDSDKPDKGLDRPGISAETISITVSTTKNTKETAKIESNSEGKNEGVKNGDGTDSVTPLLKTSTILNDVTNDDKINKTTKLTPDDGKTLLITTRSTATDGSTRYSNENILPTTQQQKIPQSTLNQILTQSTRRPISPYFTQTTGAGRYPTISQLYTSGVNAPLLTPTTAQRIQNSPAQESATLNTMSHSDITSDIRTTVPVQIYNTAAGLDTSSKQPLEITVTERGNISKTTPMISEIGVSTKVTSTGDNAGSDAILESTAVVIETTQISTTNEATTTLPESPTTGQKLNVEVTTTESDMTTQKNIVKSTPVIVNSPTVETTSSSTIKTTTKTPKKVKTNGGHHRKRPPADNRGRENEVVDSNQEETVKSTSHVITTTSLPEEMTSANITQENTGNGIIQTVQDTVKKYGPIKVSLALLTVVTILFVSIFFCCKLCKRKGYKMRQRRLREYGQEKEFLLRDRKKNDRYSNDALTLLDGSSEDEF